MESDNQLPRLNVMRSYRIFLASFLDGSTSLFRLLENIERPGSSSAELERITTPEMLKAYADANPSLPGWLLDLKEKEHKRDVAYATLFRISGSICLLASIAALCFLALRR